MLDHMRLFLIPLLLCAVPLCKADRNAEIRSAIEKSLPLLNAAALGSAEHRKCFTCHGQGLPVLVFLEAEKRGFAIDHENLQRQVNHTVAHLTRGKENYLKGKGQGGKADMAGSALWAIEEAGYPENEITEAVVDFLIQWNKDSPHWTASAIRPPAEGSKFTSTFLALRGLQAYGTDNFRPAIEKRKDAARNWLINTTAVTTEDFVFRLRALNLVEADKAILEQAGKDLIKLQRDDGGWGQLTDLESDAYATGSVLATLFDSKVSGIKSENYQRGIQFLLKTQLADGSWYIETRASPIQKYYESGFPHGEDQFISSTGTAWAILALLKALPMLPIKHVIGEE